MSTFDDFMVDEATKLRARIEALEAERDELRKQRDHHASTIFINEAQIDKLKEERDALKENNAYAITQLERALRERDSYKQDAERLRVSIEQRIDLHYSNSGNFAVIPKGRRVETHGTTAWESDEDYLNGVRAAIDRAIAEGKSYEHE